MIEYKRFDGETDDALILRICRDKDIIGSWEDVCEILNSLLGANYRPNTYRNRFQNYDKFRQADLGTTESSLLEEIKEQRKELEKERIKFRDERNEYNRIIREEARKESYIDMVKRMLSNYGPTGFLMVPSLLKSAATIGSIRIVRFFSAAISSAVFKYLGSALRK